MTKNLLQVIIALLLLGCHNTKHRVYETTSAEISDIITAHANELLEDERFHSVSIAILKKEKVVTRHFGELTIGKNNPPNDSTIYELASVTKTFLGTLAIIEEEINLNDDVRIYLDEPIHAVPARYNQCSYQRVT